MAAPTPEPTRSPTVYLEPGSKTLLLKIQVTGVTKRARDWKQNMEEALKPVVAKALDVNPKFLTFTSNQRRYTDGEIWVDFTIPNEDFDFKEEVIDTVFLSHLISSHKSCPKLSYLIFVTLTKISQSKSFSNPTHSQPLI